MGLWYNIILKYLWYEPLITCSMWHAKYQMCNFGVYFWKWNVSILRLRLSLSKLPINGIIYFRISICYNRTSLINILKNAILHIDKIKLMKLGLLFWRCYSIVNGQKPSFYFRITSVLKFKITDTSLCRLNFTDLVDDKN